MPNDPNRFRRQMRAAIISLIVGPGMFAMKMAGYRITGGKSGQHDQQALQGRGEEFDLPMATCCSLCALENCQVRQQKLVEQRRFDPNQVTCEAQYLHDAGTQIVER